MANIDALEAVLHQIQENPKAHDQADWARITPCGTTMCFAGHAVVNAGATLRFKDGSYTAAWCKTADGVNKQIQDYAAEVLELTYRQAYELFFGAETLDEIKDTVVKIINGEI